MALHNVTARQVFIKADFLHHDTHDLDMAEYESGFITFTNRATGESFALAATDWIWYHGTNETVELGSFNYQLCKTVTVAFDLD